MTRPDIIRASKFPTLRYVRSSCFSRGFASHGLKSSYLVELPLTQLSSCSPDSIDLQHHATQSSRELACSKPSSSGLLGPHQAETIREVAVETAQDQRLSWVCGDVGDLEQYADELSGDAQTTMQVGQDEALAAQDTGANGHVGGRGESDGETDVDVDDEMMDKISSSPSIEDASPCSPPASQATSEPGSSPYLEYPEDMSLKRPELQSSRLSLGAYSHRRHLKGEYPENVRARNVETASPLNVRMNDDYSSTEDGSTLGASPKEWLPLGVSEVKWIASGYIDCSTPDSIRKRAEQDSEDASTIQSAHEDFLDDLTVPYESDEDDDGDFSDIVDSRSLDSGWGSECLQDTEDIDFEFVYALHTFVATVEGQANATKGDTMVLLDDTNSYWWLVRVVKDSSIGYLPAEHIETPTERLARLNKHRNIDLSATMLGDQAEKARNPLMSAIKRRKTKTVQFAPPTYVDYSDFDYSSEEEDLEAEYPTHQAHQQARQAMAHEASEEPDVEDETVKVEPLKPRSQTGDKADGEVADGVEGDKAAWASSEDMSDAKLGDGPTKSSDGTVRDSFFKDDTVETKKITLTPNLLRDDASVRSASIDSKDFRQRPSLERPDKDSSASKDDRKKKDKREKDKKPGGLRGLFSRKDKKAKGEEDDESGRKSSDGDSRREGDSDEPQASSEKTESSPQRAPGKLQRQKPRVEPSPSRKTGSRDSSSSDDGMDLATFLSEGKVNNITTAPPASMRIVDAETPGPRERDVARNRSPASSRRKEEFPDSSKGMTVQTRAAAEDGTGTGSSLAAGASKSRMEVDTAEMESAEDAAATLGPSRQQPLTPGSPLQNSRVPQLQAPQPIMTGQAGRTAVDTTARAQVRDLTESPRPISPDNPTNPPPLMVDTSSQEEDQSSRATPSPHLIENDDDGDMGNNKDSITTSTSTSSTTMWNDASLRAFFDSGSEIRDLLAVVYDKTDVVPADSDHPLAVSLFKDQNAKLAEITTQLDNMLGDWLARKQRLRGPVG